jgi:hypothetical protein
VVHVRIEAAGLALLATLDAPMLAGHEAALRGMALQELEVLAGSLRRALAVRQG